MSTFENTPFDWIKKRKVVFLLKKNKVKTDPSSYRPISLLESLYKILAKLLARRLNPLLEHIVHEEQYGFVPKRHMSTCSYTVLRLIDRIKQQDVLPEDPAVLAIFLDIAAAFDTANHAALSILLSHVFPRSEFPELVQNLTTRGLACVSVNSLKSNYFLLSCGTGQGDPLSSPRFLILQHFFINALFKAINIPDMHITSLSLFFQL